jgi:hypothetical protein
MKISHMQLTRVQELEAAAKRHRLKIFHDPDGILRVIGDPPHAIVWMWNGGARRYNAVGGEVQISSKSTAEFRIEWWGWFSRLIPLTLIGALVIAPPVGEWCMGRAPFGPRIYGSVGIGLFLLLIWAFTFCRWVAGCFKDLHLLRDFAADLR